MAHAIELPIHAENPIVLPAGWEPISTLSRQGNTAVVLCRRLAKPPGGAAPVLTSLTPNTLASGGVPTSVDVLGSGFDTSTTVYADGAPRSTFFIDATHLQYTARPDLETAASTVQIKVQGDAGVSNELTFHFT